MVKLKYLLIILLNLHFGCTSPDIPVPDYCGMLERDQTHVTYDKSDPNYESDKKIRYQIFKDNFEEIMDYVDKAGFPPIIRSEIHMDSCMHRSITINFIHIAQSQIDLFFKEKDLLKKEIKSGRLQKDLLAKSIVVTLNTKELCEKTKRHLTEFVFDLELENEFALGESLSEKLMEAKTVDCSGLYN